MSVSLDDIWDAPVTQTPPRSRERTPAVVIDVDDDLPGPSPAKRPRTTLFLSDSDDGSPKKPTAPRASASTKLNPDIDALFNDLDPEPEDDLLGLAPSLDLDALRRQAAARHTVKVPSLTPREILPSSSPGRDVGEDREDEARRKKGQEGEKPKRKSIAKLDEARLLGPDGFPVLVKQTKSFKPKGKGHEASDLNRLLQIYQFWTHRMYPKNHFRENVQSIEKLCHSKRMQVAMSVWRDESKGLIHGRKPADLDLTSEGEEADEDDDDAVPTARDASAKAAASPTPSTPDLQPSSPSRPPSSASERTSTYTDDDFDMDALIQEDQERQAASMAARAQSPPLNTETHSYRSKPPADPDDMDEDDALWSSFNDPSIFDDPSVLATSTESAEIAPSAPPEEEDEDMWQMMRDMEEEEASRKEQGQKQMLPGSQAASANSENVGEQQRATNDEGWDEMYL